MTPTQHRILRYIWKRGETTRKEISRELDLNPSTITRNLRPLLESGIVEIKGHISSEGFVGRKSDIVDLNQRWREIVGISVERGGVVALLVDMRGNVLKRTGRFELVNSKNLVDILTDAFEELATERVMALTVGVPGIVRDGVVVFSEALGLRDFDMERSLEEILKKKVYIMNDANASVANFSSDSENTLCFLLTIPYDLGEKVGLGTGLWIYGRLYTGSHGAAGETGEGVPLSEGGTFTLDDLKSGRLKTEDLNPAFESWMVDKVSSLTNFVDPDVVILTGDVNALPSDLTERMVSSIEKHLLVDVELRLDTSGRDAVARGSAVAFLNVLMNDLEMFNECLGDEDEW